MTLTVNRVAKEKYGGHFICIHFGHQNQKFLPFVDPYPMCVKPGSGLLPNISDEAPGVQGEWHRRVQAYNLRISLSRNPDTRLPFGEPGRYDAADHELHAKYLVHGI